MNDSRFLFLILLLLSLLAVSCTTASDARLADLEGKVEALDARNARLEEAVATQAAFVSYLATRPPLLVTPYSADAEPTPYQLVRGSVQIEEGRCCVGGPAGEALGVAIQFEAASPVVEVSEMRWAMTSKVLDDEAVSMLDWEPYAAEKTADIAVPLNWSSMSVTVQFRDVEGNVSPWYSDEIAVEGMPPRP